MSHTLSRTHRPVTRHTVADNRAYARDLGARAAAMPAPSASVISFPSRLGASASTPEADRAIAAILAEHMTADWLASLTNGMAPGVVNALRDLEASA